MLARPLRAKLQAAAAVAALLLGAQALPAQAGALPSLTPSPMADKQYGTPEEAALAGMADCRRTMPRDAECGFGVYRDKDGAFRYTAVQTSGKGGSIDGMRLLIPSTAKLVGFGHTHPKPGTGVGAQDDTSDALSKEDVRFAKRMGVDMFVGSEKSGQVVRYRNGDKTENHSRLGRIAYGTPIGVYADDPAAPELSRRDEIAKAYEEALKNAPPNQNVP